MTITTRLMLPTSPPDYATGEAPSESTTTRPSMENQTHHSLSTSHLSQHNRHHTDAPPLEWIVVRIEVSDTGQSANPWNHSVYSLLHKVAVFGAAT